MNTLLPYFIFCIIGTALISCDTEEPVMNPDPVIWDTTAYHLDIGGFPPPPGLHPDNRLTLQGVKLGRMLFYEKMLSGNNTQSCASCHQQQFAFTDTARFSLGIRGLKGKRNSMSVFNLAWHSNEFFWDGRAHFLRHQALFPIQDPLEMDETLDRVVVKLSQSQLYRDQFIRAFGSDEITPEKVSLAMEQFLNTIISQASKYDLYLKQQTTLSPEEERGRLIFFTEFNPFFPELSGADCAHCHGGNNFENDQYMNNGLDEPSLLNDKGRFMVTQQPGDMGKFKVPSLRNIELTAPYMHDGRFATLEEVVEHYDHGLKPSPTLDPALEYTRATGLGLTPQQKSDLIAFLKTLTDHQLTSNPVYSSPF